MNMLMTGSKVEVASTLGAKLIRSDLVGIKL